MLKYLAIISIALCSPALAVDDYGPSYWDTAAVKVGQLDKAMQVCRLVVPVEAASFLEEMQAHVHGDAALASKAREAASNFTASQCDALNTELQGLADFRAAKR